MKLTSLLLASGAALLGLPANAAVVTRTYDLTGADFLQVFGPDDGETAAADPLRLNFTLTVDTDADTADGVTDGLIVNSFNLPYPLEYTYFGSSDSLIIGTDLNPYGSCVTFSINSDNFCAFIDNATANASVAFDDFSGTYYLSLGTPERQFDAQSASLTVTAGAVPEPASWAMMIGGFGAVGGAMRRRTRVAVRFA